MGMFVTIGAGWLIGTTSPSVSLLIPGFLVYVMIVQLILGGAMGLLSAALARRDIAASLLLERTALTVVGAYAVIYALSLALRSGLSAWGPVVTYGLLAFACIWRWRQVDKYVRWLKRQADRFGVPGHLPERA